MGKIISLFLKKTLIFLAPLLFFPLAVIVTDPFDYLGYQPKMNLDRIHTVRRLNVADWALSEVSKIDKISKSRFTVVSIGDSRGRVLMSGGFEKGWKGRINGVNQKHYDLSFGGAQLDESLSLLAKELKYLDSLETIIIILPIDRILTYKQHRNRIEISQFNSMRPYIKYLLNYKQLSYLFYSNVGDGNSIKELSEQEKLKKTFLSCYNTTSIKTFDKNLFDFMVAVSKLKLKYNIKIIIPPYEISLFKEIMMHHKEDYNYYLYRLNNSMLEDSIQIINLQNFENEFHFIDPVHGFLKTGNIYEMIKAQTHNTVSIR